MAAEGAGWKEDYAVKSYETDCAGRLRMASLFNYFQEFAGNHVVHLGIGYEVLKDLGYVWFLSRAKVRVRRLPAWGEGGSVETWHATTDGLMFIRDFRMSDQGGNILLEASTGWLLMDTAAFRPHPAGVLPIPLPANDHGRALDEPLKKLLPVQTLRPVYERNVHLSDLDVNNHVNNARYLEWIFDCYDDAFVRSHVPGFLQVNYVGETNLGDTVALSRGEDPSLPGVHYIEGASRSKGSKAVQALIGWESTQPGHILPVHKA
ncbi:MAG TPA: acyl-ACP thioesterase domain-containing protein [Bacteroidota bacterium]|nr:acyl-ACP thioesterase domain-containing protein [Bacteroidota bacterium]